MSHFTHPAIEPAGWLRAHRTVVVTALLALLATAAVVLILALSGDESTSSVTGQPAPAARAVSGPDESAVAAAAGLQPSVLDESRIAAAIGSTTEGSATSPRPDESAVAGAIAQP
jgi:hypothetical protein